MASRPRARRCSEAPKSKLQGKIDEPLLAPVDDAQIAARPNQPNFVADSLCEERCLGVIEHNAFLAVHPACALVDLGNDGLQPESENPVLQRAVRCVKNLALPGKMVDQLGDLGAVGSAGSDDRGSFCLAIRNVAGRTVGEKLIELSL